jgi:hypothetical protein
VCLIEETKSIKIVQWQWYAKVMVRQKDNGEIKKSHNYNAWIHQHILELLEYLHPRLKDFVIHNFVAKW